MTNLITITEDISEIKRVNDRVVYIYNRWKEAIQSDRLLIDYYLQVFYRIDKNTFYDQLMDKIFGNKISFEAITRAGRKLREKYPERYARSEDVAERCAAKEVVMREYYGGIV